MVRPRTLRDVSEARAAKEKLAFLAHHDPLTGLPNRSLYTDRFEQAILKGARDRTHLAVLFVDLDRFKEVNDLLGHAAGDLLLKEVASRLRAAFRASDSVCRLGGDEFAVLARLTEAKDAARVAEKAVACGRSPFLIAGQELYTPFSVGVAICPDHGTDIETLSRRADAAMYLVKRSGRDRFEVFRPEMEAAIVAPPAASGDGGSTLA